MCAIDYADGDWTPLGSTTRKARKRHRCDECSRHIEPGESYHRSVGIAEGHFYASLQCPQCEAAAQWLVWTCGGYLNEGVEEDLAEHWDEPGYRCLDLGRLILGMRRDWRRRDGQLYPVETVDRWARDARAHGRRSEERAA